MKEHLKSLIISRFETQSGKLYKNLPLSYEQFGQPIGDSPVVLINHAMTANSTVSGKDGWWSELVGEDKLINTKIYTIIAFNIPGNGYDGTFIKNYQDFMIRDIAKIFLKGIKSLDINKLHAVIGGSIGGSLAWEIAVLAPELSEYIIPVATDWKATDWILANIKIQHQILKNSFEPLRDARMHAMNLYRTPQSYKHKFARTIKKDLGIFNVESWLLHHADKLSQRYELLSYKMMNHLLSTIDITRGRGDFKEVATMIKSKIVMIGIDTDMFFVSQENKETFEILNHLNKDASYLEINSIHGHDAFLIEFEQLNQYLKLIFQ